ncbi:hypothetical protein Syun_026226 [Stephania yunnanensis]|uniref:Uncharacterized protein n=1 Tax=Stephania yunnanensis TaxID=152371 RepID=A0AAP0HWI0_9MAGN
MTDLRQIKDRHVFVADQRQTRPVADLSLPKRVYSRSTSTPLCANTTRPSPPPHETRHHCLRRLPLTSLSSTATRRLCDSSAPQAGDEFANRPPFPSLVAPVPLPLVGPDPPPPLLAHVPPPQLGPVAFDSTAVGHHHGSAAPLFHHRGSPFLRAARARRVRFLHRRHHHGSRPPMRCAAAAYVHPHIAAMAGSSGAVARPGSSLFEF